MKQALFNYVIVSVALIVMFLLWWFQVEGLAALVTAIGTIGVGIVGISILREHNELSVQPHLQFEKVFLDDEESKNQEVLWEIHNNGHGPAIIKGFSLFYDGAPISVPLLKGGLPLKIEENLYTVASVNFLDIGESMPSKSKRTIIRYKWPISDKKSVFATFRIGIKVEYCSIYGEAPRMATIKSDEEILAKMDTTDLM